MLGFRLDKWYFDCATASGIVWVGYAATLHLGPIPLHYGASILQDGTESPTVQRQSLRSGRPCASSGLLEWSHPSLRIQGTWTGGVDTGPVVVHDGKSGRITWHGRTLNAQVAVTVDGRELAGPGYAEQLEMTVPPWRLPFRELRWGRFISDDRLRFATWIDMKGDPAGCRVWTERGASSGAVSDDAVLRGDGTRLVLKAERTLRCENVAKSLLGRFHGLSRLFPRSMRNIGENKMIGTGPLVLEDGSEVRGVAVFEVVRWE
jgi:hypothetical protein